MTIANISSASHLHTLLGSNTYVVVDFHADWCGPCKAIAPVFAQLASSEAKPGRMAFAKVDVDAQQAIAQQYGVSAMPTFLVIKNGKVANTLRGADPSGLRSAVMAASADAAKGSGRTAASFQTTGHVLGNKPSDSRPVGPSPGAGSGGMAGIQATVNQFERQALRASGPLQGVVRFVGLYLVTLLSLDPHSSGEQSAFNVRSR